MTTLGFTATLLIVPISNSAFHKISKAHAQSTPRSLTPTDTSICQQIRNVSQLAVREDLGIRTLDRLEEIYCDDRGIELDSAEEAEYPVFRLPNADSSSQCEVITAINNFTRMESNINPDIISQVDGLSRTICNLSVEESSLNWSNGRTALSSIGNWYYPNGQRALSSVGNWYYPNGERALSSIETWYYPNENRASITDLVAWSCSKVENNQCDQWSSQIDDLDDTTWWQTQAILMFVWHASQYN
ncbi:MAG: hypothetical protein AB4042_02095 [Leptolyngbyaceae cyanobacterium]